MEHKEEQLQHQNVDVHIVAVPFPLQGHVNGLLQLARALAALEGVLITFAFPMRFHSFALQHNKLPALHSNPRLRLEVVQDGLPLDEAQTLTPALSFACIPIFQNAFKLLFHDLLHQSQPPSCIISDTFCPWTQDLADAAALPRIDFWSGPAAVYSMGSKLSSLVSNGILPLPKSCWADLENKWSADAPLIDCVPGLPPFPVTDLPHGFVHPEDVSDPMLQFMLAAFGRTREAHTILVHSVYELESQVFDALQADGYPIQAVGPLLNSPSIFTEANNNKHKCLDWLDKQSPSSVIYVALGSLVKLNPPKMHALALGLEASGHPFLWVIRRDAIVDTLDNALPQGFLQRTTEKGLGLIIAWAPQTEVLSHPSIGAFFSHCGWNSTLECVWEGVPMVACPDFSEQRSNARWIVENWKIGVHLERQLDSSFTKEAVKRALKEVLGEEGIQGTTYKERALHAKILVRSARQKGGTSYSNLLSFRQRLCRSCESRLEHNNAFPKLTKKSMVLSQQQG